MNKEYYSEYYNLERSNWWFLARRNILTSQIKNVISPKEKLKILNIGVATGASSQWLSEFGTVTSVEYDKDVCDFLNNELKIPVIQASITELPFDGDTFDLICAFDVIEHVDDDNKAVQEMKRVCMKNGHIFITVPAYMHLWSEHDEINLHCRRYTLSQLNRLVIKEGLDNIKFKSYFNTLLYPPISLLRLGSKISKKKKEQPTPKSDFNKMNSKVLEKLFFYIFNSEKEFLKKRISFPFGVSIMIICQKF